MKKVTRFFFSFSLRVLALLGSQRELSGYQAASVGLILICIQNALLTEQLTQLFTPLISKNLQQTGISLTQPKVNYCQYICDAPLNLPLSAPHSISHSLAHTPVFSYVCLIFRSVSLCLLIQFLKWELATLFRYLGVFVQINVFFFHFY